jgi:hypothetical protein
MDKKTRQKIDAWIEGNGSAPRLIAQTSDLTASLQARDNFRPVGSRIKGIRWLCLRFA